MTKYDLEKPILLNYENEEVQSSFQIAKDVEVHFSCSTKFKGDYFVFGGRENQSSVRQTFFSFAVLDFQIPCSGLETPGLSAMKN